MIRQRIDLYLGRSVPCRQNLLGEGFAEALDLDDSELLAADADNTLKAASRAEGTGLLERIVAHWGHAILVHVGVA